MTLAKNIILTARTLINWALIFMRNIQLHEWKDQILTHVFKWPNMAYWHIWRQNFFCHQDLHQTFQFIEVKSWSFYPYWSILTPAIKVEYGVTESSYAFSSTHWRNHLRFRAIALDCNSKLVIPSFAIDNFTGYNLLLSFDFFKYFWAIIAENSTCIINVLFFLYNFR